MPVARTAFGTMPDGTSVDEISLQHPNGLMLKAIQYGGIIRELHVPDRNGDLGDIVLGLPTLEAYLDGHPMFGTITGRVAGRITGGTFRIDDQEYALEQNNGGNLLHGGSQALDKQVWDAETGESESGEPFVTFHHISPDGACGFPGELDIQVTYQLTDASELKISYEATTTKRTPLSLTNHSYFNLAGEGSGAIENHMLQIHADRYVPSEDDGTLTGIMKDVTGTPNDAREPRRIGDLIATIRGQHGEHYFVNRTEDEVKLLKPAARVEEPDTGRVMEVFTTASSVQFYSAVALDEKV
ncbi:MAG: aldose epimerase family protein [Verrucomicrobiota bacterium]